jgi:hypothetical protein
MRSRPKAEVFKGILCSKREDFEAELDDKHSGDGDARFEDGGARFEDRD